MRFGGWLSLLAPLWSACSFNIDAITAVDGGGNVGSPNGPADADLPVDVQGEPADAVYVGLLPYSTFAGGSAKLHAWRHGRIAFYTWDGGLTVEDVTRWATWYEQCLTLYEAFAGRPTFLADDPNFGAVKPIAVLGPEDALCHAPPIVGCADQVRVEAPPEFALKITEDPANPAHHYDAFMLLGHGPVEERFEGVGVWPPDGWRTVFPQLVAGVCLREIGGDERVHDSATLDRLRVDLQAWSAADASPALTTLLDDGSHPVLNRGLSLLSAMLFELYVFRDASTLTATFEQLATGPRAQDPHAALCDLQNAIAAAAGRRLDELLVDTWDLPDCAETVVGLEAGPDHIRVHWSWTPGARGAAVTAEIFSSGTAVVGYQVSVPGGVQELLLTHEALCAKVSDAGVPLEPNHGVRVTVRPSSDVLSPGRIAAIDALPCASP